MHLKFDTFCIIIGTRGLTIFVAKKVVFFDILEIGLELFRSCLGIVFGLKRPILMFVFNMKGPYMTSKIKFLGQNLAL